MRNSLMIDPTIQAGILYELPFIITITFNTITMQFILFCHNHPQSLFPFIFLILQFTDIITLSRDSISSRHFSLIAFWNEFLVLL